MGKFIEPEDPRIRATRFVVRASYQETHLLWYRWCHVLGLDMIQDRAGGSSGKIGEIDGRPILAEVWWYTVLGEPVAMVNCVSPLADYTLLDEWILFAFPNAIANSDAANFQNVLAAVELRTGRRARIRDARVIGQFLATMPRNER